MSNKQIEMSKELKEQLAEAKRLQDDIRTASDIILRGLAQYTKKKIGARNKAQVEDQEKLYAALDDYTSKEDIQNAYGWEIITEAEYNRLYYMWDARENSRKNGGKYADRVTEMLEIAARGVGDKYWDQIYEAREAEKHFRDEVKRIEKENRQRDWERKHGLRI